MDCPFIIDPDSSTYCHQFERARLDSWVNVTNFHLPHPQAACASSSSDTHYAPYPKPEKPGSPHPTCSFCDPKNTLCLRCGNFGHCANTCHSSSNCADFPTIIN